VSRVVIADAGPLIALSQAGQLSLLRGLFGGVDLTEQIRAEVLDAGTFPGQEAIREALDAGWLHSQDVDLSTWQPRRPGVDDGEASAIVLAQMHAAALLIIDDRAGRAEATARGLAVMGVAAVVGLAKMQGLLPRAAPVLAQMRANGYFIGPGVVAAVLARVGEAD
jgi:predicted nucleic acid-binding protein